MIDRNRGELRLRARCAAGRPTQRVIWPLALGYFEMSRIVVAWCELRSDFRHFRTMHKAEISPTRYLGTRTKLLARWRTTLVSGHPD